MLIKKIKNSLTNIDFSNLNLDKPHSLTITQQLIAGSLAGIVEHISLFPLDAFKTNLQASKKGIKFKKYFRNKGCKHNFMRIYHGSLIVCLGCIPTHASYFYAYETLKKRIIANDKKFHFIGDGFIGAISSIIHDIIMVPIDVIKQRQQICRKMSIKNAYNLTLKREGILGLYRSLPVTIMMNCPYSILVVSLNENIKRIINPEKHKFSFAWFYVCAAVSGAIASIFTNPLDVIKTRLQTQNLIEMSTFIKIEYKQIHDTAIKLVKQEGFNSLFKGLIPRISLSALSVGVSWMTYEIMKNWFYQLNK